MASFAINNVSKSPVHVRQTTRGASEKVLYGNRPLSTETSNAKGISRKFNHAAKNLTLQPHQVKKKDSKYSKHSFQNTSPNDQVIENVVPIALAAEQNAKKKSFSSCDRQLPLPRNPMSSTRAENSLQVMSSISIIPPYPSECLALSALDNRMSLTSLRSYASVDPALIQSYAVIRTGADGHTPLATSKPQEQTQEQAHLRGLMGGAFCLRSSLQNMITSFRRKQKKRRYIALHGSGRLVMYKSSDRRECKGSMLLEPTSFLYYPKVEVVQSGSDSVAPGSATSKIDMNSRPILHVGNQGHHHMWLEFDSPETLEQWVVEIEAVLRNVIQLSQYQDGFTVRTSGNETPISISMSTSLPLSTFGDYRDELQRPKISTKSGR